MEGQMRLWWSKSLSWVTPIHHGPDLQHEGKSMSPPFLAVTCITAVPSGPLVGFSWSCSPRGCAGPKESSCEMSRSLSYLHLQGAEALQAISLQLEDLGEFSCSAARRQETFRPSWVSGPLQTSVLPPACLHLSCALSGEKLAQGRDVLSCQGNACAVRALPSSGAAWLRGTFASFNHTLSAAFF